MNAIDSTRIAAEVPQSGEDCKAEGGRFRPEVDARRCEGKAECVAVCPYHVFEVGRMATETFRALLLLTKIKVWAHDRRTAHTPNADACHACGLCVKACLERAIRLVKATG